MIRRCIFFFLTFLFVFSAKETLPCSMYKITKFGKTMVGCNHDAWFVTPKIWFETEGYGAAFTGARLDGSNGTAPQSGMNEYGLSFSRLSAATPPNGSVIEGKKSIKNHTLFLKEVLHKCKTVEEVDSLFQSYDHSSFSEDVLIYIDKSGKYLIIEPYITFFGNDSSYVLANFCPSQVEDLSEITQERYRKGVVFLRDKSDTSLAFCRALSDTMHVCRKRIGDGTLITSIWDLNGGFVNLYFYHNYNYTVRFKLSDELEKGNHSIDLVKLFPENSEFDKLVAFKNPKNNDVMMGFMMFSGILFLLSAIYFSVDFFWRKNEPFRVIKILFLPIGMSLFFYSLVLAREVGIYYFPAPYQHHSSLIISCTSYIPFVVLLFILPLCVLNFKVMKTKSWTLPSRWLLTLNSITLVLLIGLFFYWGLYDVF